MACSPEERQHKKSKPTGWREVEGNLSRVLERSTGQAGRPKGPAHLEERKGTGTRPVHQADTGEKKQRWPWGPPHRGRGGSRLSRVADSVRRTRRASKTMLEDGKGSPN